VGVTKARDRAMFSIGEHGPMDSTRLGRYGVGIKIQAINAGHILEIASTSEDGRMWAVVDWRQVQEKKVWAIVPPKRWPVGVGTPTGTVITISNFRHQPRVKLDDLRRDLALNFHPALTEEGGKAIHLNGELVEALAEPKLTDIIDQHIPLSGGRSAALRGGILAEPSKLRRVHIGYEHRVIMPNSFFGCGNFGSIDSIFVRVQLRGGWALARFKDDLTDEDQSEELADAIYEVLLPILEKCASASMSARLQEILRKANDLAEIQFAGARRPDHIKKEPSEKSEKRVNVQGIVAPEKSTPEGPARSRRAPHNFMIITLEPGADDYGYGYYAKQGQSHRVNLCKDHPVFAELLAQQNQGFVSRQLVAWANVFYVQAHSKAGQGDFFYHSFGNSLGELSAIQDLASEVAA
jgi:hypothetical protein